MRFQRQKRRVFLSYGFGLGARSSKSVAFRCEAGLHPKVFGTLMSNITSYLHLEGLSVETAVALLEFNDTVFAQHEMGL